jgi:hypothetical protein
MKLELKHLAPYLPYGLKCEILDYKCDYVGEKYGTIKGYYYIGDGVYYTFKSDRDYAGKNTNNFKPILRPLSDLTKEIIEKYATWGKVGVNHMDLEIEFEGYDDDCYMICRDKNGRMIDRAVNSSDFDFLYENHFDVFGLIDKGLAININTL